MIKAKIRLKEAMVDIWKSKKENVHRELAEYCEEQYGHFIIVNEKSTGSN